VTDFDPDPQPTDVEHTIGNLPEITYEMVEAMEKALPRKSPRRARKPNSNSMMKMFMDPGVGFDTKRQLATQIMANNDEGGLQVLAEVFLKAANSGEGEHLLQDKMKELKEFIEMLGSGPVKLATYLSKDAAGRCKVVFADGSYAFPTCADKALTAELKVGDRVWADKAGAILLFRDPDTSLSLGEQCTLDRIYPDGRLDVTFGSHDMKCVVRASNLLLGQVDAGEAEVGSVLIASMHSKLAFYVVPPEEKMGHFRFIARDNIPDVVVDRDVGAPAPFIGELGDHIRREMTNPGLSERYRMRKSIFRMLTGSPGTGKTFSINATWNLMYQVMGEVVGVAPDELPKRVLHLRASEVNSKWFGESDKNIAQFFDEVEMLAADPYVAPDGKEWHLPVLVIAEEIEAMGRNRGEDSIHDRIMATLLQRLDPGRDAFKNYCVCLIATSNNPQLVDRAILRRIGGSITRFGSPDKHVFRAVLQKQLRDLPFAKDNQQQRTHDKNREAVIEMLVGSLYRPGDEPLVELTYAGPNKAKDYKFKRDFITPALVDRAVQETCQAACRAEWENQGDNAGLSGSDILGALEQQIINIAALVEPGNADMYLTLPDDERVVGVKRLQTV